MNIGNVLLERIDQMRQVGSAVERKTVPGDQAVDARNNPEPTVEMVHQSVDQLNNAANQLNERISFSYNEKVNRVVVKVINEDTNEVVREIPPRDIIRLTEHIQQYLGMFVDESR